ncbi:MAG: DNA-binding protein [Oceanospirillaceae bacterium]
MPKRSETSDKVQLAADELLARGQRPTQQAVRELIGTGSITTINHALNHWWSNLSKRINRQGEHPELPDPVITAASKLWDQALLYSHAALKEQRLELEKKLEEQKQADNKQLIAAQDNILSMQQQNNRLLEANEKLLEQKSTLSQKVNELEAQLIRELAKNGELQRETKQLQIIIDSNVKSTETLYQADDFFQAKIDIKVNEAIIRDLKANLLLKENHCNKLQQQLFDQEKASIKQIHRLEIVIAQQDTKYQSVKEQLDNL